MPSPLRLLLILFAVYLFAGCSGNEPDIKDEFTNNLTSLWGVKSFKVVAKENVGTKINPEVHYRFNAEVELKEDLFKKLGTLSQREILEKTVNKGSRYPMHGTAKSFFYADEWQTSFEVEEDGSDSIQGLPLESFNSNYVVFKSDEFTKLFADFKESLDKKPAEIQENTNKLNALLDEIKTTRAKQRDAEKTARGSYEQEREVIRNKLSEIEKLERNDMRDSDQALDKKYKSIRDKNKDSLSAELSKLDKAYFSKSDVFNKQIKQLERSSPKREVLEKQALELRFAWQDDKHKAREKYHRTVNKIYHEIEAEKVEKRQAIKNKYLELSDPFKKELDEKHAKLQDLFKENSAIIANKEDEIRDLRRKIHFQNEHLRLDQSVLSRLESLMQNK